MLTSATPRDNESLKMWSYFGGIFGPVFRALAPKHANFPELIRAAREAQKPTITTELLKTQAPNVIHHTPNPGSAKRQ
jgi:hypothetical protein